MRSPCLVKILVEGTRQAFMALGCSADRIIITRKGRKQRKWNSTTIREGYGINMNQQTRGESPICLRINRSLLINKTSAFPQLQTSRSWSGPLLNLTTWLFLNKIIRHLQRYSKTRAIIQSSSGSTFCAERWLRKIIYFPFSKVNNSDY